MLFAVDVDGVCATPVGSSAYGAYLRASVGVGIASSWRHMPGLPLLDALLQDQAFTSWHKQQSEEQVNDVLSHGQYSPIKYERVVQRANEGQCLPQSMGVPRAGVRRAQQSEPTHTRASFLASGSVGS